MASVSVDAELESRVKKATEKISENMHIVANEPSLAFYRLQEHVRKSLPPMINKRVEVLQLNRDLQGCLYDVEYGLSTVKSIEKAGASFSSTQKLIKDAIFYKQQLKHDESRNKKSGSSSSSTSSSSSVYRRLSAHMSMDNGRPSWAVG